ncbi:MAG TPA: DUF2007 domain-containing protein [Rhodanobacteraceae bacterium]|nr:DUF2007 domain-containing protein [Rhodanobacteraceae bacterium]
MHIAYRATNLIEATLVKDALEADGVRAFINGEYLAGIHLLANALISVVVADDDVEHAAKIVATLEAERPKSTEPAAAGEQLASGLQPAPA